METQLSNKCFKFATVAYVGLLVVSFFILSAPPGKLGVYVTMAALAVVACFVGKSFFRVFGILALVLALGLSAFEYKRGQELRQKVHELTTPSN